LDPITWARSLYPSYVLHWPDDGYYTAETCRHVINNVVNTDDVVVL